MDIRFFGFEVPFYVWIALVGLRGWPFLGWGVSPLSRAQLKDKPPLDRADRS